MDLKKDPFFMFRMVANNACTTLPGYIIINKYLFLNLYKTL